MKQTFTNMKQTFTKDILENKTILYVEDDEYIGNATIATLKLFKMKVLYANNGQVGLNIFKENKDIDLVLTDIKMPILDGLTMIEEMKKIDFLIPSVITTAYKEVDFLQKSIELGVSSYAIKPIDIYQLRESLIRAIEPNILRKIIFDKNKKLEKLNEILEIKVLKRTLELEKTNEKLLLLATTDFLTNIPNRRYTFDMGNKFVSLSVRHNTPFSVLMFDIDFFKKINDLHGHAVGDSVLKFISSLVSSNLRESDLFGRVGGEEFLILLNRTDLEGAKKIAEKIRCVIQNTPYDDNGCLIQITVSMGIGILNKTDTTFKKIYRQSDIVLYQAKREGRNCIRY